MKPPVFQCDLFTPVHQYRRYLQEYRELGVICMCCDQYVKEYKRKLNSGMARALWEIYRITRHSNGDAWLDLGRMLNRWITLNREWSKLCYWGLLEGRNSPPTPGREHGVFRITPEGVEFVLKQRKVRRYVCVYNNELLRFEGELIDIEDAFEDKFNYPELMSQL